MSVQRYIVAGRHLFLADKVPMLGGEVVIKEADHARIVAEMEQAHEAALVADQVNTHGFIESVARHESMLAEAKALLASRDEAWDEGYAAGLAAAAPRTLTDEERAEEYRLGWEAGSKPRTLTADGPEPVSLDDMGTDGQKWAQAFVDRFGGDEGLMIGWFANAIEAGRTAGMASGYPIEQPNLIHDGEAR